ncbi:MAG: hypothetical protein P8163_18220, partial [Candidatus Thiodiazotropha sp.]
MTACASIQPITLDSAPHFGQIDTSMLNIDLRHYAQLTNAVQRLKNDMCGSIILKRSVGQREGCACGGAGQGSLPHIHVPATLVHPCTARND